MRNVAQSADNARTVAAIFHDVPHFQEALRALREAGFGDEDISVLSPHSTLAEQYGDDIPSPETLEDSADTPRDSLDEQSIWHSAASFIGESLGIASMYAVAGAAFFVGGPVGVASQSSNSIDLGVEAAIASYVDDTYADRFRETLEHGGLICWVHAADPDTLDKARRILEEAGGDHVHRVPDAASD